MPEMHCGPLTKNKERIQKFNQNEQDKASWLMEILKI